MLFATLVLVAVNGEHDGLQQCVDLGHGHQAAEMGDMARLGLEQEQQVAVLLRLLVVGKEALLQLGSVVKMACDLVLLHAQLARVRRTHAVHSYLFQRHAILNEQCYPRVEVAHVFFENKVLLRLRRDPALEFAQYLLGCRLLACA